MGQQVIADTRTGIRRSSLLRRLFVMPYTDPPRGEFLLGYVQSRLAELIDPFSHMLATLVMVMQFNIYSTSTNYYY